jgi:hypothetical protein
MSKEAFLMPFVLKHHSTNEIYSCELINIYDIAYHGAKSWEDPDEAEEQYEEFLTARDESPEEWSLYEVEESQMKMFNVKLNNNPIRSLYLDDDGRPFVRTRGH